MLIFLSGTGAQDFEILSPVMSPEEWTKLKGQVIRLLKARGKDNAANILNTNPFELSHGTNYFNDEFYILHLTVTLEEYIELEELKAKPTTFSACKEIASTFNELNKYIRFIVVELSIDEPELVPQPIPELTNDTIKIALQDSQNLLYTSGASSAVDRIHTALHGYLKALCVESSIVISEQPSITELFKAMRTNHPIFDSINTGAEETKKIFGALATIVDSLNTLRNNSSIAHPNEIILSEEEAILAINSARTIFNYINSKTIKK
jgi:hypothetical protein